VPQKIHAVTKHLQVLETQNIELREELKKPILDDPQLQQNIIIVDKAQ
jgi:hypothetical protein